MRVDCIIKALHVFLIEAIVLIIYSVCNRNETTDFFNVIWHQ